MSIYIYIYIYNTIDTRRPFKEAGEPRLPSICGCVCFFPSLYVCMSKCTSMYEDMYTSAYAYVHMYVCMHACMYVCVHGRAQECIVIPLPSSSSLDTPPRLSTVTDTRHCRYDTLRIYIHTYIHTCSNIRSYIHMLIHNYASACVY